MLLRHIFPRMLLCLFVASVFVMEAKATSYHYEGKPFDYVSVTGCCGLRIVADVAFNFDTTGVSGFFTPADGSISFLLWYSTFSLDPQKPYSGSGGDLECSTITCHLSFTLSNGAIVGWTLQPSPGGVGYGAHSFGFAGGGGADGFIAYGPSCTPFFPCGLNANNQNKPGTWSIVPVPGPTVGAGLPGFLIAIFAFVGWRRKRLATKHPLTTAAAA